MSTPHLKGHFLESVVPQMMKSRGYKNRHQVPAVEKIVINSGVSSQLDKSAMADTVRDITLVAGQKAVVTKARVSIANFKVRDGDPVGVMVTLRGSLMYEFLQRLLSVVLPGIRDFRGTPAKLDGQGNYTLGIVDHTIFPEVNTDNTSRALGMDVTLVTSASSDGEGYELLSLLGMPFRKK